MEKSARILVAGGRGLVGSAIVRRLTKGGFETVLAPPRAELNLADRGSTDAYFAANKPTHVFMAAAKVGGILANSTYPGDFIRENLAIELNIIEAARQHGTEKFVFLGSSCIYPKMSPQPIREDYLLTGELEATNRAYAIAKIAGIEMIRSYREQYGFSGISLMPTNLYGPGDNFDLQNSHVLPALIRKFHEAKLAHEPNVVVWGSGTPRREFLHVDDLADACVHLMQVYDSSDIVNIGVGEDIAIGDVAQLVSKVVGYRGDIVYDRSKPDGTPRKLLDVGRLHATGWKAKIGLEEGITGTYQSYLEGLRAGAIGAA